MKANILFTIIIALPGTHIFASDTATRAQLTEHGIAIASGGYHACALESVSRELKCWSSSGLMSIPHLHHPLQFSAGHEHTCALDETSTGPMVHCWGKNDKGQSNVPNLIHPTQISAGYWHSCAMDENSVKCWGDNEYGQTTVPPLNHPTQLSAGRYNTCALDDDGVKCWGGNADFQRNKPALNHPVQVSAGGYHTCALDDDGVKCWGNNGEGQTSVPPLIHPTQVTAGYRHTCALDDSGVKCWGWNMDDQINVPSGLHSTQVAAGIHFTCATNEAAVRCWGRGRDSKINIPYLGVNEKIIFSPSTLAQSYLKISQSIYHEKGMVLKNLSKTIARYSFDEKENLLATYKRALIVVFSMHAVEPLIRETHSSYFQENILPNFTSALKDWNHKLDITDMNSIDFSAGVLDVCFTLVESGLQVAKSHVAESRRSEWEDLMLKVGQAKALSTEDSIHAAKDLVKSFDQHQVILSNLIENQASVGLGKMLLQIQSYLRSRGQ